MTWKNKRKKKATKYDKFSVINKFKSEGKITNKALSDINNIALEDLIAIKLELSTRYTCGKFYGMPLWRITRHTVTDALLKTIDYMDFNKYIKKYKVETFFENGDETVSTEKE